MGKRYLFIVLFFIANHLVMAQTIGRNRIEVVGNGIVMALPDKVNISVSVNTTDKTAIAAKTENDNSVRKVIAFLKSQKLSSGSYKTDYVQLYKNYEYIEDKKEISYNARQKLHISLTDVSKYDEIMLGVLNLGVDAIENVSFDFQNKKDLIEEARRKAVEDALYKADVYAKAAKCTLGDILLITEDRKSSSDYEDGLYDAVAFRKVSNSPTIEVGNKEISVSIKVVFELKK